MNFKEYQDTIKITAKYPANVRVLYPALGLAGETGEGYRDWETDRKSVV